MQTFKKVPRAYFIGLHEHFLTLQGDLHCHCLKGTDKKTAGKSWHNHDPTANAQSPQITMLPQAVTSPSLRR